MARFVKGDICPRCQTPAPEGEYPALSRRDNQTNICSSCGTQEALVDFEAAPKDWIELDRKFTLRLLQTALIQLARQDYKQ